MDDSGSETCAKARSFDLSNPTVMSLTGNRTALLQKRTRITKWAWQVLDERPTFKFCFTFEAAGGNDGSSDFDQRS